MKYVIKDQKSIDERVLKAGKAVSNDTKGGHYDHETTDTTGCQYPKMKGITLRDEGPDTWNLRG